MPHLKRTPERHGRRVVLLAAAAVAAVAACATVLVASAAEEKAITYTTFDDRLPPPFSPWLSPTAAGLHMAWGAFLNPYIDGFGEFDLELHLVERRELTSFGAGSWINIGRVNTGQDHTTSRPMVSGRTYEFRLGSYYRVVVDGTTHRRKSPYSDPVSYTAPTVPAPTGLTVTSGEDGLTLTWNKPEPYESDTFPLNGYIVLKSTIEAEDDPHARGSAIGVERIAVRGADTTTYLDESTVDTRRYSYRVLAVYNYVHSRTNGHGLSFIPGISKN